VEHAPYADDFQKFRFVSVGQKLVAHEK
jgi:hypothetical protein